MRNQDIIRERYLRDSLATRLGGIAANLSRVKSFATHAAGREAVADLLEESKFFIEWTAHDADVDTAAELVDLQIQLALWQHKWDEIWANEEQRRRLASASGEWAQRVLMLSGLLD